MKRNETNINVLLAQKGIETDKQLADMLEMPPANLSARLVGDISMDTLERISKVLGVPVYDLIKRECEQSP